MMLGDDASIISFCLEAKELKLVFEAVHHIRIGHAVKVTVTGYLF
jgi:hypothetical protein